MVNCYFSKARLYQRPNLNILKLISTAPCSEEHAFIAEIMLYAVAQVLKQCICTKHQRPCNKIQHKLASIIALFVH